MVDPSSSHHSIIHLMEGDTARKSALTTDRLIKKLCNNTAETSVKTWTQAVKIQSTFFLYYSNFNFIQ